MRTRIEDEIEVVNEDENEDENKDENEDENMDEKKDENDDEYDPGRFSVHLSCRCLFCASPTSHLVSQNCTTPPHSCNHKYFTPPLYPIFSHFHFDQKIS